MATAPDVLITVSELIPFTEVIDDKFVIVNPGVCIKGKAGGSFDPKTPVRFTLIDIYVNLNLKL